MLASLDGGGKMRIEFGPMKKRDAPQKSVIPRQTHNYRISVQDTLIANSVIMRLTRNYRFLLLAAAGLVLSFGCRQPTPSPSPARLVERTSPSMGSELQLTAWTTDEAAAVAAFEAAFRQTERLDGLMSTWRNDSDIERLNGAAGRHPVQVSTEVRDVLEAAGQVSDWTGGKFDVTFGALSGLWKFDYQDQDNAIPDRTEVLRRLRFINYTGLEVDEEAGTAFLKRSGMRVNLGGIGKGYAVDRAAGILRQHGLHDFMIQFGGDMYAAGNRGGRPWRLGIQDPREIGRAHV